MDTLKNNGEKFKFPKIETPEELVEYLDDVNLRLRSAKFLYHYTTLSNAISIFQSHSWHLCRAEDMNDFVEFNNGDKGRWGNIFLHRLCLIQKRVLVCGVCIHNHGKMV
jgi:hypothetical protein